MCFLENCTCAMATVLALVAVLSLLVSEGSELVNASSMHNNVLALEEFEELQTIRAQVLDDKGDIWNGGGVYPQCRSPAHLAQIQNVERCLFCLDMFADLGEDCPADCCVVNGAQFLESFIVCETGRCCIRVVFPDEGDEKLLITNEPMTAMSAAKNGQCSKLEYLTVTCQKCALIESPNGSVDCSQRGVPVPAFGERANSSNLQCANEKAPVPGAKKMPKEADCQCNCKQNVF